jgi:hypothetical protein
VEREYADFNVGEGKENKTNCQKKSEVGRQK